MGNRLKRISGAALFGLALLSMTAPDARAAERAAVRVKGHAALDGPRSLADLTHAAGTVIVGRVTDVRVGSHPRYPRVTVTYVTLLVSDTWKGAPGRSLTFMQFGNASEAMVPRGATGQVEISRFCDLPTYTGGEEVLLFLHPESPARLTSPVGGFAGKLAIHREPETGRAMLSRRLAALAPLSAASSPRGEWVPLTAVRAKVVAAARQEIQNR
jgi:hypothetical protein